jgi:hypothetical protein
MFIGSIPESKNYVTCILCKDLVQIVDDALVSNSTIDQVIKKHYILCVFLENQI